MPNIDTLIESVSQQIIAPGSQDTCFSTLNLKYAYSQLNLDTSTANHSNFNIISGDMTGLQISNRILRINRYVSRISKSNGLYPNWSNEYYCFLDDILVVSIGSLEKHTRYVMSCLRRLDDKNLRINLTTCNYAKLEIYWLEYHNSQSDISPNECKTSATSALEAPKTLKNTVFFWGRCIISVNLFQILLKLVTFSVLC